MCLCPVQNRYMYVLYTHVLYSTCSAGVYPRPYSSLSRIEYSTRSTDYTTAVYSMYDCAVIQTRATGMYWIYIVTSSTASHLGV